MICWLENSSHYMHYTLNWIKFKSITFIKSMHWSQKKYSIALHILIFFKYNFITNIHYIHALISKILFNQYYVMNYSVNSFTCASEANFLVQGILFCIRGAKHFWDMVHGTKSIYFDPISRYMKWGVESVPTRPQKMSFF